MALNLEAVFAVLKPDLTVDLAPVTPAICPELDVRYDNFTAHTLVSIQRFDAAWNVWERHLAGDEVV